jgi:hypothetical protein
MHEITSFRNRTSAQSSRRRPKIVWNGAEPPIRQVRLSPQVRFGSICDMAASFGHVRSFPRAPYFHTACTSIRVGYMRMYCTTRGALPRFGRLPCGRCARLVSQCRPGPVKGLAPYDDDSGNQVGVRHETWWAARQACLAALMGALALGCAKTPAPAARVDPSTSHACFDQLGRIWRGGRGRLTGRFRPSTDRQAARPALGQSRKSAEIDGSQRGAGYIVG